MRKTRSSKNPGADQSRAVSVDRLLAHPDGLVAHETGKFGQIVIAKKSDEVMLVFCPLGTPLSNDALSGVMARMDLRHPKVLKGVYTQAMLASLTFAPDPTRVYIVGAGGGRLATALNHLLNSCKITGSEIDPIVLRLSRKYLGLKTSSKLNIACADGQTHLARQPDGGFEHIYLDCYGADGHVPSELSTQDFFAFCARKLSPGGVLCANFIDQDPNFRAQMDAFFDVFPNVWKFEFEGSHVLFGHFGPPQTQDQLRAAAEVLQNRHDFGFDFAQRVADIHPLKPGHVS